MSSRPRPSRKRFALALALSLVLHAGLLLLACALRSPAHAEAPGIDPRVSLEGRELGLINWSQPLQVKGSEEDQHLYDVHVEQTLTTPFRNENEPGPIISALPGNMGMRQHNGGKTGIGGKGEQPSFFQMSIAAKRIVFALDRSLSMGLDNSFIRARAELCRCLDTLPEGTAFQVVLYNRAAETVLDTKGRLLRVEPDNLRDVEQALAEIRPEGGTDYEKALEMALGLEPEVIFLVTDADDLTPAQLRHIKSINRSHVVIHTIDVSRRLRAAKMLAELAHENGGQHLRAP
jgi:hypothetical protein